MGSGPKVTFWVAAVAATVVTLLYDIVISISHSYVPFVGSHPV